MFDEDLPELSGVWNNARGARDADSSSQGGRRRRTNAINLRAQVEA